MVEGLSVPNWQGVGTSVALVGLAALIAYRQHLHLTRELLIAAARAGVQLVAVGAILLILFRHTGLPGALGWVVLMVGIAGQVAGRRGAGLPHADVPRAMVGERDSQWHGPRHFKGGHIGHQGRLPFPGG